MNAKNGWEIKFEKGIFTDTIKILADDIETAIKEAIKIAGKDCASAITSDEIKSIHSLGFVYY